MLTIHSKLKDYNVYLEDNLQFLTKLAETSNAQFVIDAKVMELYRQPLQCIPQEKIITVEATEEHKVIETALEICEKITEIAAKRNTTLISLGGGIIQDLTGFVANIMYRGIQWIYVPTTLLAACDSCIGGKTSLNYKKYKNLLGTFYPPDEIYICPQFFNTLSRRDYLSGLGEVVKFNLMQGGLGLANMERDISKLIERDPDAVRKYVLTSLQFKKPFIEVDEFDRGERIKLNFAHTFGHAIEVITGYEIPHGTAVAIGMIMANHVSASRGYLKEDVVRRMEQILLQVIEINPKPLAAPLSDYLAVIRKDKKQIGDSLTAVLITKYSEMGELQIIHDMTEREVEEAIAHFRSVYES